MVVVAVAVEEPVVGSLVQMLTVDMADMQIISAIGSEHMSNAVVRLASLVAFISESEKWPTVLASVQRGKSVVHLLSN